eukprot:COSAG02_NODE_68_length_42582_cov_52.351129_31_plen_67_part_00
MAWLRRGLGAVGGCWNCYHRCYSAAVGELLLLLRWLLPLLLLLLLLLQLLLLLLLLPLRALGLETL